MFVDVNCTLQIPNSNDYNNLIPMSEISQEADEHLQEEIQNYHRTLHQQLSTQADRLKQSIQSRLFSNMSSSVPDQIEGFTISSTKNWSDFKKAKACSPLNYANSRNKTTLFVELQDGLMKTRTHIIVCANNSFSFPPRSSKHMMLISSTRFVILFLYLTLPSHFLTWCVLIMVY